MPLRLSSISYSIRLFVITAVMAAAMLVLLAFELIQRQVLLEQNAVRVDSLTAPAFILDNEFQRFQHALELHLYTQQRVSKDVLQMRLDVLISKVEVVRESPGSAFMFKDPQNMATLDMMQTYVQRQ